MEYNTADDEFEVGEPCIYHVGVYLTDRAYGGPEEGGWWYDCGELVTDAHFYEEVGAELLPKAFLDAKEAYDTANKWQIILDKTVNVGRHPKSSVLSRGIYETIVMETFLPHHFPSQRPYYE